jgi:hypothetical protein
MSICMEMRCENRGQIEGCLPREQQFYAGGGVV